MTSSSDKTTATTAISTLTTHNSSTSSSYDKMKCKLLETEEELKNLKKQKLSSDDNIINKRLGLNTIPNCPGFSRQMYIKTAELSAAGSATLSSQTIKESLEIFWKDKTEVPETTFIKNLRRDMRIVEELNAALRIAKCKRIIQLIHDGSSLNAQSTFSIFCRIEMKDGTIEDIFLTPSAIVEGKIFETATTWI